MKKVKTDEGSLKETLSKLTDYETNIDKKSIEKLQKLVTVNDELKSKEQEFKKSCKKELAEIEAELDALKLSLSMNENGRNQENERISKINEQYEAANAKLKTLRLKVAKKNREISTLKRRLDEIPSRIELSQYQKRFVELYNQSNFRFRFLIFEIINNFFYLKTSFGCSYSNQTIFHIL